jgi:hypothetical protein
MRTPVAGRSLPGELGAAEPVAVEPVLRHVGSFLPRNRATLKNPV